jgi:hypothetical protein
LLVLRLFFACLRADLILAALAVVSQGVTFCSSSSSRPIVIASSYAGQQMAGA